MRNHHSIFPVKQMAKILGVSYSGYYDFIKRPPSSRSIENKNLLDQVRTIHQESLGTYGSPRIHAEFIHRGFSCSRQRVARIMKANHLQAKMVKRLKKTTKRSDHLIHQPQDLVQQNFNVLHPNTVWVNKKWAYLAVILDLFSRKIVGMALKEHMKTDLILQTFQQALTHRNPPKGLIHHSDLGSQYTSHDLQKMANQYGVLLSYGRSAYDNAVMESFFHTLKTEHTYFKVYQTIEEATLDIFTYIFTFYNTKRRHSTLQFISPNQFEINYQQSVSILTI